MCADEKLSEFGNCMELMNLECVQRCQLQKWSGVMDVMGGQGYTPSTVRKRQKYGSSEDDCGGSVSPIILTPPPTTTTTTNSGFAAMEVLEQRRELGMRMEALGAEVIDLDSEEDAAATATSLNGFKTSERQINIAYTDGSCLGNGRDDARAGIGVFFGEGDPRCGPQLKHAVKR